MSWDGWMWILSFVVAVAICGEIENRLDRRAQLEREIRRDGGETEVDVVFDAIERKRGGK